MEDPRSDYQYIIDRDERSKAIKEGEGLKSTWQPDGTVKEAMKLYAENPQQAKAFLTNYTQMTAQTAVDSWKRLGEFLIVRYNDGAVKPVKDGKMVRPASGHNASVSRPGYSEDFLRNLVKETGDRYKSK